jgi:hypothetical protein
LEWDPNQRDAWVSDAQRWISQIKGVLQCKIDLDSEGEISGVHVVAGMDREPRHIVRDVESLLKARLEIDVFYKKIGVVQVLDNGPVVAETTVQPPEVPLDHTPEPPTAAEGPSSSSVTFHAADDPIHLDDNLVDDTPVTPDTPKPQVSDSPPMPAVLLAEEVPLRIVCSGVGVMASDMLVRAEVQLSTGEMEVRGTVEGANHGGSAVQLVARATLDALARLVTEPILLHLNEVRIDSIGDHPVVLCAVELVEGRKSETLFGSCSNLHNEQQAVVFAILDALNRRLSMYSLKSSEAEG